jgi:hypothetical protein
VIEEAIEAFITIAPATDALLDGVAAIGASITIAAEIEAAEDTLEATTASITIAEAIEAEAEGVAVILKLALSAHVKLAALEGVAATKASSIIAVAVDPVHDILAAMDATSTTEQETETAEESAEATGAVWEIEAEIVVEHDKED